MPYDATEQRNYDGELDAALTKAGVDDDKKSELKKAFAKAHARLQSRVIGKALSSAKSGKPFDILLGHYGV